MLPRAPDLVLRQAVAAGDPDAKYRLAKVLEGGLGVDPDPKRALALYEEAAEANIPAALNDMGYFHFTGELGLPVDRDAALALFREAGWSKAQVRAAIVAAPSRPAGELVGFGEAPPEVHAAPPATPIGKWTRPEHVQIVCAGGPAGRFSAVLGPALGMGAAMITREVSWTT